MIVRSFKLVILATSLLYLLWLDYFVSHVCCLSAMFVVCQPCLLFVSHVCCLSAMFVVCQPCFVVCQPCLLFVSHVCCLSAMFVVCQPCLFSVFLLSSFISVFTDKVNPISDVIRQQSRYQKSVKSFCRAKFSPFFA